MSIGQLVDFCIEYNNRQTASEEEKKRPAKHYATQAEIDAFFGG